MENVVLTIILPIYNKSHTLEQCLDSFARKEFEGRLEVLAIDDGSEDHSLSIALNYRDRYPGIYHVIQKTNGGVGSVMNVGLNNASGKYIKEVDADDYVYTEALETLLIFLENCTSDIVLTHFEDVDEDGCHIKSHYITDMEYAQEYEMDTVINCVNICIQNMAVRKKLLTDNHFSFEETRYYVDMQLVCDSMYYAATCVAINCMLYCYRLNQAEQSVSLESYIKNKESFRKQTERCLERVSQSQKDKITETKKQICSGWASNYSGMLYVIYLMDCADKQGYECIAFDTFLKRKYPEIYEKLSGNSVIRELREKDFKNIVSFQKELKEKIEKLKMISHGSVMLRDVCSLELGDYDSFTFYRQQKQIQKFKMQVQLLNHWFMKYQQGKKTEQYLLEKGITCVAIYGFGVLGERLYQELMDGKVQVSYIIDRNAAFINHDLKICTLMDDLQEVDAVVVTVMTDFPVIMRDLRKKVKCPVISLEDILYGD